MSPTANQNPEQIARDRIDQKLVDAGWVVFDKKAVGVIEVKPEDGGHKITAIEVQSQCYANATLLSHPKNTFSDQLVPQDPNFEHASVLLERIRLEKKMHIRHESSEEVRIG